MDRRIRTTHILEATGGGTRRHLHDLLARVDAAEFASSLICSRGREESFGEEIEWLAGCGIPTAVTAMSPGIRPGGDLGAVARVARLLRGDPPDIVHTHSTKAGLIGRLAARRAGIAKVVHTPHCWPFDMVDRTRAARWMAALVERFLAKATQRIVCVCAAERESALSRNIAPPGKFCVIPNGVSGQVPGLPSPESLPPRLAEWQAGRRRGIVLVGTVGRLCRQKGQLPFLETAALALQRNDALRFVFVGGGPLDRLLEQRCHKLGISHRCLFTGHLRDPQPLYRLFDIVAVPSFWEALPYTLLDAMQSGCAIVAHRVGGIPEWIADRDSGLLVGAGQPAQFADLMLLAAADRRLRERLGAAAVKTAAGWSVDKMVRGIETIYRDLV